MRFFALLSSLAVLALAGCGVQPEAEHPSSASVQLQPETQTANQQFTLENWAK